MRVVWAIGNKDLDQSNVIWERKVRHKEGVMEQFCCSVDITEDSRIRIRQDRVRVSAKTILSRLCRACVRT